MDNCNPRSKEIPVSELTGKQWVSIYWGFWWRSACIIVAAVLLISAIYISLTFITIVTSRALLTYGVLPYIKRSTALTIIKITAVIFGFPTGVYLSLLYIKWVLNARYGPLRLAIVLRDDREDTFSNVKF